MSDNLRDRIAAAIAGVDDWRGVTDPAILADAVVEALGAIPDRQHTDDEGRIWEWCGGQPGTWAWRITALADKSDQRAALRELAKWAPMGDGDE
jgi:hypothetical protein